MGVFKAIGDFLFGKDPDIFDESGKVRHKFTESKWQKWNERLKSNPDYDWRQHSAKKRADGHDPAKPTPPTRSGH